MIAIEVQPTSALTVATFAEIVALCTEAYEEPFAPYFEAIGPGTHMLGRVDGDLVCHLLWVDRRLQVIGTPTELHTAYIEAVATRPGHEGRGYASALLRQAIGELSDYDVAALSPSDARFYERLGWVSWRGSLFVRRDPEIEATPDEEIMIYRLPNTPASLDATRSLSVEWRPGEIW